MEDPWGISGTTTVLECIEGWRCRRPAAPAVEAPDGNLTYQELDQKAEALADALRGYGIGAGHIVALRLDRSALLAASVLAVWKTGAAYLPLDPCYPAERLDYMLSDSGAALVMDPPSMPGGDPAITELGGMATTTKAAVGAGHGRPAPDDLAYVIYTSGSTGRPKGVEVLHRGLPVIAAAQRELLGAGPGDRVLAFASPSFDASVFELLMSFATGATLCVTQPEDLMPGEPLGDTLAQQEVTIATIPPSSLGAVPYRPLPRLRLLTVAGEPCTAELVDRWAPGRRMANLYGPTEATIWSTWHECVAGEGRPPIGVPIPGVRTSVVDADLRPVPDGEPGELCVGGQVLARGYLGRDDLTADRFIEYPEGQRVARWYRTGDIVQRSPRGVYDFIRRVDAQVKIRGYRVETGEVESALATQPAVRECAVVARPDRENSATLVAYLVAEGSERPTAGDVRAQLARTLPDYMVPSVVQWIPALPLTPNGKLDRNALLEARPPINTLSPTGTQAGTPNILAQGPGQREEVVTAADSGPSDLVATQIAQVFEAVLEMEAVGIDDNFFEIGGHSVKAASVASRVSRAFGLTLPLREVFDRPTPAALAVAVRELVLRDLDQLTDEEVARQVEAHER
ncbi:MAG: non-ribosomal peptide synthetase [Nocardioides sp.]|uniref:non-ribosomal peptide synthetase n=1 Tax=Nocardioides sp. TaxID=35761 RepID=UPI0039E4E5EE